MNSEIISLLRCPLCHGALSLTGKSLVCDKRHCYDIARQGHVNFVPNKKDSFYTKELFESRAAVFAAGVFEPVIAALTEAIGTFVSGDWPVLLDAGCGEGYYAKAVCPDRQMTRIGFDISKEDTTKNEYKKFEAVINSAGYFVVQGGTDEEIQNALDELQKAYEWFEFFVTELHTEPVTTTAGAKVVYFSSNKGWANVNAYCWSTSNNQNNAGWPGVAMTYVETNDMGEKIFSYEVPEGMNMIIFNNGSQQTEDLSLEVYTQNGFYLDSNASGKWTVGQYER